MYLYTHTFSALELNLSCLRVLMQPLLVVHGFLLSLRHHWPQPLLICRGSLIQTLTPIDKEITRYIGEEQ